MCHLGCQESYDPAGSMEGPCLLDEPTPKSPSSPLTLSFTQVYCDASREIEVSAQPLAFRPPQTSKSPWSRSPVSAVSRQNFLEIPAGTAPIIEPGPSSTETPS
jgi:hypothetical protein